MNFKKKFLLLLCSVALMNVKAQIPTNNLVLKYFFDDQTANDGSGNGNNGVAVNTTTTTDRFGNANQALSFNGTSSYVSLTDAILNNQTISISFWFKSSINQQGALLGHQNSVVGGSASQYVPIAYNRSDYMLHAGMYSGNTTTSNANASGGVYTDGNWHHLVIRANGTSQSIYIDNFPQGTSTNGYNVLSGMTKGQIGAAKIGNAWPSYPALGWVYFNGVIDDLAIYHGDLTIADINALYTDTFGVCNVSIPDANFKAYLVGNSAINTNNDTEIQCSEASAFTGSIICNNLSISDMTGIEAFTSLTLLNCNNNSFTTLDITQNTALTSLSCDDLNSLDVTQNTALTVLSCGNGALSSLNLTQNTALTEVQCQNNQLVALDVSQNTALTILNINDNLITSMDLSLHSSLVNFYAQNCALTSLNVANGNNTNMIQFWVNNNPNLSCIEVDNVAYSTTNWTVIDAVAGFSTNCILYAAIKDSEFQTFKVYPNPTNGIVNIDVNENLTTISLINIMGEIVKTFDANSKQLDVSTFNSGVYFLKIANDNKKSVTKLIIK